MHIIFINLEKSYMKEDVPKGIVQQLKTYMYAKSITAGVIERTIRPKKKRISYNYRFCKSGNRYNVVFFVGFFWSKVFFVKKEVFLVIWSLSLVNVGWSL